MTEEYRYYNNDVKTHREFREKVEQVLKENGGWMKTPEIQAEITGGKHQGWSKPVTTKSSDSDGWSSEWTRNILYDIWRYLQDNNPGFEAEKEKGPGQDHNKWRLQE